MAAAGEPPKSTNDQGAAFPPPDLPRQPTIEDLTEARKLIREYLAETQGQPTKLTRTQEKVDKAVAAASSGGTLAGAFLAVAAADPTGIALSVVGLLGLGWSGYRWAYRKLDARRDRRAGERNNAKLKRALELLRGDEPAEDQ
jgi:hypothetical protein